MKIFNRGRGIHEREVPGIDRLQKDLPDEWRAYTNLELALTGGSREIDVIMIIEDRILAVDLKDWRGKIESDGGGWKQNGKAIAGKSPVEKILSNARELGIKLERFLQAESSRRRVPKLPSPRVQGFVVLTATQDRTGIAPTEVDAVFTIDAFVKLLRTTRSRIDTIGGVHPHFHNGILLTPEWNTMLGQFFNVKTGAFRPSSRQYGSYRAHSDNYCYQHPSLIYTEYDVEDAGAKATGLLRRWDFTKAETRFQTEAGRREIAGRERAVLSWLNDRNAACEAAFLQPRAEDTEVGVEYWEVFDRRRRLLRLSDFALTTQGSGNPAQLSELVRQMLAQAALLHDLKAAHLDIGGHSVWLESPSTVRLSHLMAATLPELQTLGEKRYQFLSSAALPEDVLKVSTTAARKDVFLLGCSAHSILFGAPPAAKQPSEPPEWDPAVDGSSRYPTLHAWLKKSLSWDPADRYGDAGEMLAALNSALATGRSPQAVLAGLDRFRAVQSQRQLMKEYPEAQDIRDDNRVALWLSDVSDGRVLLKLWKREGWGDQTKESPRILSFLEAAEDLIAEPHRGFALIKRALWLGDAIALVTRYEAGDTLNTSLAASKDSWALLATRRNFSLALIDIVTSAHQRNLAHGDIKPDNVIVRLEEGNLRPLLVDVLDFSPGADGERCTGAYSPPSGGRFERDRFGVTKVVEEVLGAGPLSAEEKKRLTEGVAQVRQGPPENGTLAPLREALERISRPPATKPTSVTIVMPRTKSGPLLPDEGAIAFRRSMNGTQLYLRGACEQLVLSIRADGSLSSGSRVVVEQKRIRQFQRFEAATIPLLLSVEDGSVEDFSELEELLQKPELSAVFAQRIAPTTQLPEPEVQPAADEEQGSPDRAEDDLTEEMGEEKAPPASVDVPTLWQKLMTVESDQRIEGVALGDSSYRRTSARHVVPFQLEQGLLDFDRDDTVLVSRKDKTGRPVKLGALDIHLSRSDLLQIDTSRAGWRPNDTIVRDGQRLQFTSHYEQTSRSRRREALDRVLGRMSRIQDLVDIFDVRKARAPTELDAPVDEAAVKRTYGLNDVQTKAFASIVRKRPLGLLQGPPGTGKTLFIGALVHYAITNHLARNVLLASQSHEAVNGAAEAVLRLFEHSHSPSILRVGHESDVSELLLPYHVVRVETLLKDRFRAEFKERLTVVGEMLGLPDALVVNLVHIETVVAPVVDRLLQLEQDDARLNGLLDTLKTVTAELPSIGPNDLVADDKYLQRLRTGVGAAHGVLNAALIGRFSEAAQLARDFINSASSRKRNFESFLAGTRQAVIGTCVGLGRSSLGLTATPFDLVVVDEAARCTAGELLVPLQAGRWVVLVGDHHQLEPQHKKEVIDEVAGSTGIAKSEILRSDFERVFESAYGTTAGATLTEQYRMLSPIGTVVSDAFYPGGLTHGRSKPVIPPGALPTHLAVPLTWMFTDTFGELARQHEPQGKIGALDNPKEVELILQLLRLWDEHEPFRAWLETQKGTHSIGIICAYSAQADLLRQRFRAAFVSDAMRQSVKIDTVDSYQGKENPIVIFSLVRNNDDGRLESGQKTIKPGFMARPNRINVAMSRAMDRLIIVGASEGWETTGPLGRVSSAFAKQVELGTAQFVDGADFLETQQQKPTKKKKAKKAADAPNGDPT